MRFSREDEITSNFCLSSFITSIDFLIIFTLVSALESEDYSHGVKVDVSEYLIHILLELNET